MEIQKAFRKFAQDKTARAQAKRLYADQRRCDVQYEIVEWVLLELNPGKHKSNLHLPNKWQEKYLGPV